MPRDFSLDDKYTLESGSVYMTGIQALVRLPIEQMRRDRRVGLKTATWISGYEGSPLGGYDLALARAGKHLSDHNIRFLPGVNEDLAATSVMGSQLFQALPDPQVDGVVGIWYGKGPGVDRSGDVFRHANLAGTGSNCGALALAGDDHVSKSSTIPHQSEISFYNHALPTLTPGNTQEVLDYGLWGIALSRYTGAWTGIKVSTDICDGGGTVEVSPDRVPIVEPDLLIDGERYEKVMNPLLIIPISLRLERELHYQRMAAAKEFARCNDINQISPRHNDDRLGIVTAGKSYYDLMSAFRNIGIGPAELEAAGIRILKLGMVFPLEPTIINEFVEGLDRVLVIEEKRSFIELQLRDLLYHLERRPAIWGKLDPAGDELLPANGELDAEIITRALGRWLGHGEGIDRRLAELAEIEKLFAQGKSAPPRIPSYCSGCPHNRSTYLLEGQIAGGGIGCHGMAASLGEANRGIEYIAQMGGEGAAWIGASPFSGRDHIFQNLGDGTYFHSGRMAVNAAVSANVNITYKILYNGTVAMTGGQDIAGSLPIPALTRELEADGVKRIALLTDDLTRYENRTGLAEITEVRPREDLDLVLRELERTPGVTVMIYDQMCAAEKRRRRNRGLMAQPVRRLMVNERVCEGCGDCVAKSNCVSLHPVETEFGPKTRIHQSSCNADYTCALGDCPSFVSVMVEEGTGLRKRLLPDLPAATVAEPMQKVTAGRSYRILMPGIGGTGVVTINAVLATAALLDGKYTTTLDQTGLAQKGGAVVSHLVIGDEPIEESNRISYGAADLLLGFDAMGAAAAANLCRTSPERTAAVVNSHEIPTHESIRKGLTVLSADGYFARAVREHTRGEQNILLDASRLAESLFGGHLQTNMFLLGAAYQAGLLPLRASSVEESIRLNGVQVDRNVAAFRYGRQYVADPAKIESLAAPERPANARQTLEGLIRLLTDELVSFQNAAYARRYETLVAEARRAEQAVASGSTVLTEAVARYCHKLMAYKDEYEVARLLTLPDLDEQAKAMFEAPVKQVYHLHPPLLRAMGLKRKLSLGPWARPFLKTLAAMKFLRGSMLDVFGYAHLRCQERALIGWYEEMIRGMLPTLTSANLETAVEIARLPDRIRGYEQIKLASIEETRRTASVMLARHSRSAAA
ncbi:MAG: indolepyruvate ferredoxin oxidoreductase family protein [Bryobacterales bacterium]|nr:indolepyruvate ferredoxin oxidoreductase family protein [Bryobacterales bacterium]